jgi:hypothetical protein
MKSRFLSLLLVIAVMLALVPAVSAQGGEDLTCLQLSEADCAILQTAMANSEAIQSFMMDFGFDVALTGLGTLGMMMGGDAAMADMAINVTGNGPLSYDMEAMPPLSTSLSITGNFDDGIAPEAGTIEMIMVDGIIYVREGEGQWEGVTFEDAMNSMDPDTQAMLGGLMGGDLSALPAGALTPGELAGGDPTAMLEQLGIGAEALNIMNIPGFITQSRVADTVVDGQTMYVFETVIDSGPLFASPDFQTILNGVLGSVSGESADAAEIAMLAPMLLSGLSVNVTLSQWIGADDMFVHGMSFDMVAGLDLAVLFGAAGGEGEMQLPPITLTIGFDLNLSDINGTFDIVAPEGAKMIEPPSM